MQLHISSNWACVHQLTLSISENWLLTPVQLTLTFIQGKDLWTWFWCKAQKLAKWFGYDISVLITETAWWDSATADATNTNMKRVALTRVFVFRNEIWDKRRIMPASTGLENSIKERLFLWQMTIRLNCCLTFLWLMTIRLNCCLDQETLYVCVRVCSSRCNCVCVHVCAWKKPLHVHARVSWVGGGRQRDREESGKIVEELI